MTIIWSVIACGGMFSYCSAATIVDGDVTIDVVNYDPATGWIAGEVYDAQIAVNFNDTTTIDKSITITLAEGVRFVNYPVIGTPASGSPGYTVESGSILEQFISSVTEPPRQTYYPSYNGSLTYNISTTCESIEIPFKVTVDENVYYGPKTIVGAIYATAHKDTTTLGNPSMDVNADGYAYFSVYSSTWQTKTLLTGSSDPVLLPIISNVGRHGILYPLPFYAKKRTAYYYYPKEVDIVSMADSGHLVEHNATDGYLYYEWYDTFATTNIHAYASAENTAPGLYTASERSQFQVTMYDDTVVDVTAGYAPMTVNVLSSIDNKLQITTEGTYYYKQSDDYNSQGPHIRIFNDEATDKTNQHVEYTIDPNYEVIQTIFPKDPTLGVIGDVQYKTNLNPVLQTADPSEVVAYGTIGAYISKDSLGLSANEYITYVNASIGGVSKGFQSVSTSFRYISTASKIVGKLKDGIDAANVTVRTYALLPDDTVEPNSDVSSTRTVSRIANPTTALAATSNNVSMNAGETKRLTFTLNGATYYYSNTLGLLNPKAYIRIPENTEIDLSSITVTGNYDGALPFTVTGPYTSAVSGERFLEIAITGKVGSYFDMTTYYQVVLSFDFIAGLGAGGNYNWEEYVFWRDDVGDDYQRQNGYPAVVFDTLDVDNDGNTVEKLVPAYNRDLSIISKQELLIDTYIIPEGGERQVPYDGTAQTAIGFTPGTTATYTVDMLNNRTDAVNSTTAYIPIPKDGNNFGTNFQDNEFYWNMKLSGTPSITVYDEFGTDITAAAASNYVITYAQDATNASNYETATYTTTPSDNTTMIKVENTTGIPAGEQAILAFDYVVDETIATVQADPTKLGATNDFRPYYYFNSGTSGWQSGTRVGAILQIGQIAGQVFLDQDIDGIYNNTDTLLENKTIDLYKHNGTTYAFFATTTTDVNGHYTFDELSNGNYRIDFTTVPTTTQQFTKQNQGTDESLDSDPPFTGTIRGRVDTIDPTDTTARNTDVGIIDYDPATQLDVTLNKATTSIKKTNAQTTFTEQLTQTITPSFFESIKASTTPVTWASSDPTTVSVSNGLIQGSQEGTATITITITDMYGNTDNAQTIVTVTSNDIPTITATDQTITANTTFDPLALPTAYDTEDGDITANIIVTHNAVDTTTAGVYTVSYTVTDSDGNVGEKEIGVTVEAALPTLTTLTPTAITHDSVTGNAEIINAGGESVERFIQIGAASGHYTHECSASAGTEGTYACALSLIPGTTYYMRAKAINSAGAGYGAETSFTTLEAPLYPSQVTTRGITQWKGYVKIKN